MYHDVGTSEWYGSRAGYLAYNLAASSVQLPIMSRVRQWFLISVCSELDFVYGIRYPNEGLQGLTYGNLISMRICILPMRPRSLFGSSIERR